MADASLRSLERAAALAPEDAEITARLIAERLRAGGRDPRLHPQAGDVVQDRGKRGCTPTARVVLATWPQVTTWEVTALPMTAEGGEAGAAALARALDGRSMSLARLVPGCRLIYIGSVVRRPRPGRRGWDTVEVQTAPGVWATYQVEAGIFDGRTASRLDLTRFYADPISQGRARPGLPREGIFEAPPAEEVEWQSYSLHEARQEQDRRYGRGYLSRVHAWRDWCRDGRIVRGGVA